VADESPELFDDIYLGLRAGGAARKQRRGVRLELLEELAEAVVDEPLMDELLERAELRGS